MLMGNGENHNPFFWVEMLKPQRLQALEAGWPHETSLQALVITYRKEEISRRELIALLCHVNDRFPYSILVCLEIK